MGLGGSDNKGFDVFSNLNSSPELLRIISERKDKHTPKYERSLLTIMEDNYNKRLSQDLFSESLDSESLGNKMARIGLKKP